MTHVLIAVDDDEERAELQADRIAEIDWAPNGVEATILHVFTENDEGASVGQFRPARAARDRLEEADIDVTLDERSGDPERNIVAHAEANPSIDLVSVAGRTRSPAGKAVFGSVSQGVMLNTDLPVLFCPSDQ